MIICSVLMDEEKNGSRTCVEGGGGDSGDNRSSKRLKQKKVPQRGLGVAQLEKIRLEEQQKKDVVSQAQACTVFPPSNEIMPPPTNKLSSSLALRTPNFKSSNNDPSPDPAHNGSFRALNRHFFVPPPSISLQTTSPNGGSSTNSLFRPSLSLPNIDDFCSNQMTLPKSLSSGGGSDHSWPKLWNDGFNLDRENQKLDHGDPILHFPNLMQRSMKSQQPHPSSKMEPPSNQSYFLNMYSPLWKEEEKMVGLKRQYPFTMDIPPAPPFHEKLSSSFVDPFGTSHESASNSNGSPAIPKPRIHMTREPSRSTLQAHQNSRKAVEENGDFLRLAPPLAASLSLEAKRKHTLDNSGHPKQDLQKASQELFEDRSRRPITNGSNIINGQPFFSFLPSPNYGSCDNEVGERVDLSLKL